MNELNLIHLATQETRFKILSFMQKFEHSYFVDFIDITQLSKSTISQHLSILEAAGLIQKEKITKPYRTSYLDPKFAYSLTEKGEELLRKINVSQGEGE